MVSALCFPTFLGIHDFTKDEGAIISYLQSFDMLPKFMPCDKCSNDNLQLCYETHRNGLYHFWQCHKPVSNSESETCNSKIPLLRDTWFDRSNLSIPMIVKLVYMILNNFGDPAVIAHELDVDLSVVFIWLDIIQEVTENWIKIEYEQIGGPEKIVEIGEIKIIKDKCVKDDNERWLFGGVQRDDTRIFFTIIDKRDRDTFMSLMNKWILPGSKVISCHYQEYHGLVDEDIDGLKRDRNISIVKPSDRSQNLRFLVHLKLVKEFIAKCETKDDNKYLSHYLYLKSCKLKKICPFSTFWKFTANNLRNFSKDRVKIEPLVKTDIG